MHNPMVHVSIQSCRLRPLGVVVAAFALACQPAATAQANQTSGPSNVTTSSPRVQNNPTAQNPLMTVPEDFAGLKLAPGFLLNIMVYDEPDLSARVRVDKEGNINLPFLKTLHVGGDTVAAGQAEDRRQVPQ